jgi:phenylalanyl-tRNA synthetase beta chain
MLCSYAELLLGGDGDGIIELAEDAEIGASLAEHLGINDPLIDIAVTPNRGDALGVRGIARELAAAGLGTLKPLNIPAVKAEFPNPITVNMQDANCPAFVAVYIKGVRNSESPEWLRKRLESVGMRPISTLVDITNFISHDLCRPLHVFDAQKLSGGITVRPAVNGESLLALNDKEYILEGFETVIADDSSALALGGIMGGIPSGCTMETANVLLECAWFNPMQIAKTGRFHSIDSDARHRFERSVDPEFLEDAAAIATSMILELCGGSASEIQYFRNGELPKNQAIEFDVSEVKRLGGVDITLDSAQKILGDLGFESTPTPMSADSDSAKKLLVKVPAWRNDISGKADLVEEILRIYGYDNIPALALPQVSNFRGDGQSSTSQLMKKLQSLKVLLASRGLTECTTFSFTKFELAKLFAETSDSLRLLNPISSELDYMRPTLLIALLEKFLSNASRGNKNLRLFEIGRVFKGTEPEKQPHQIAGIRGGLAIERNVHGSVRVSDLFDAKADAIAVLDSLGLDQEKITITNAVPAYFHPARSGALTLGGKVVMGYFGEVHPGVLKHLGVTERVAAFEIDYSSVPVAKSKAEFAKPALKLSDFPVAERDFAFVVDEKLTFQQVTGVIRSSLIAANNNDKSVVKEISVFDIFTGKDIPAGKKSIAVSIKLDPINRTFTDAEIAGFSAAVIKDVKEKLSADLRS